MVNVGIIGFGYWGPNLARNFCKNSNCSIRWVCDINPRKTGNIQFLYPHARITSQYEDILTDDSTDAVVIVTPLSTHYQIARKALQAGKHVFIEKPFVRTESQAEQLYSLARKQKKVLMVGFSYVYSPAVSRIKSIIDSGSLGTAYYINSVRVNFGIFRKKENVVWDLAVHDFSILLHWFKEMPYSIVCSGKDSLDRGFVDTAVITLYFKSGLMVYILVSWLSPIKMRNMIITGSKRMLFFNDERGTEKIKIFSQGSPSRSVSFSGEFIPNYHKSSVFSPWIDTIESLEIETKHFIDCIRKKALPVTDGAVGVRVVRILEAADKSLRHNKRVLISR